jgi:protein-L-isoaspartate(D-aspartate) O-methyltransferase
MAFAAAPSLSLPSDFFASARQHMVESQLRPNKVVNDALLEAFGRVPREAFVPEASKSFAYIDENVSIGYGRHLMAPMILGRLIQELDIRPSDRVLAIGAGTGYTAAILNSLAGEVVALESDPALLRQLQQNKSSLGLNKVFATQGALSDGVAERAPYQAIVIEGGIQWLPAGIAQQLDEGGRLACIVYNEGDTFGKMGEARLYEKRHGVLSGRGLFDASAPVLQGFATRPRFVFG